jgi:hypothetical protein
MRSSWLGVAVIATVALLAASHLRTSGSSGSKRAWGAVVGTLVRGTADVVGPVGDRSFRIRLVGGGVFRVTTNADGRFRLRGRPGTYYPAFAVLGSRSDRAAFRIVAGRTTHVVVNADPAAWQLHF